MLTAFPKASSKALKTETGKFVLWKEKKLPQKLISNNCQTNLSFLKNKLEKKLLVFKKKKRKIMSQANKFEYIMLARTQKAIHHKSEKEVPDNPELIRKILF